MQVAKVSAYRKGKGFNMSYVAPVLQAKFETLSIDLKNSILERDVELYTMQDLIRVLGEIVNENDTSSEKPPKFN